MNRDNIIKMENILDEANKIIRETEKKLEELKKMQNKINELNKYYGSKEWFEDKKNYENKKIKNIKAGVLSEDAVYDLLEKNKQLAITLLETGTNLIKNN